MSTNRNHQIQALIEQLSNSARIARDLSLDDTARLLAMAQLDLQTKLHSISADELRSFTRTVANVVEFKVRSPANDTKRAEGGEGGQKGQVPVVR
ncbi:MAG TPA: hypothetical protein VKP67_29520 [Xanthobacteraceae bacterium]|nr:hypothetical protein [Xanthobacteraceae bacterium]